MKKSTQIILLILFALGCVPTVVAQNTFTATSDVKVIDQLTNPSFTFTNLPRNVTGNVVVTVYNKGVRFGYMQQIPYTYTYQCGSYCCSTNWLGNCTQYCPTYCQGTSYNYQFAPNATSIYLDNNYGATIYMDNASCDVYSSPLSAPTSALQSAITNDGAVTIQFYNSGNYSASCAELYVVLSYSYSSIPLITSVKSTGEINEIINIGGDNFQATTGVYFNGRSAPFGIVNNFFIRATVPSNATSGPLTVTSAEGVSNSVPFSIVSPVISVISPSRGGAGTTVTITGNYLSSVTDVRFGGVSSSSFRIVSSNTIEAVSPSGGFGPITLISPSGVTTSSQSFRPEQTVTTIDSLALVAFYNSTNGSNWTNSENWLTGSVNTWYGVGVMDSRVISIIMGANNLTGTLPPEIGQLTGLRQLAFQANGLTGAIPPEIGNLTNLVEMEWGFNQLSGNLPSEIGNIQSLSELNLYGNQLTGSIPPSLWSLTHLTQLSLGHNQLSGGIPGELSLLHELNVLQLDNNNLSGYFPDIRSLSNLRYLEITSNDFTYLAGLPLTIEQLYIQNNYFTFGDIEPYVSAVNFVYWPQKTISIAGNQYFNLGDAISVNLAFSGSANSYQWYKNNSPIAGAMESTLTIANASLSDEGDYFIEVTNSIAPNVTLQSTPFHIFVINRPNVVASNLTFSNVTSSSMQISFTPGNGEKRVVLMRESLTAVPAAPADPGAVPAAEAKKEALAEAPMEQLPTQDIAVMKEVVEAQKAVEQNAIKKAACKGGCGYIADGVALVGNSDYAAAPLQDGYKVVMVGTASSVLVTGLAALTNYEVKVIEYNGSADLTHYGENAANATQMTLPLVQAPTTPVSNITFSDTYSTQMKVNFTAGNGQKRLIVVKPGIAVDFVPADNTIYSTGELIGGNKIFVTETSSVDLSGLLPNTLYYLKIFEFNSIDLQSRYLTVGAPQSSKKTLTLPNVYVTTPANNAINQNVSINVSSKALTGAATYAIELNDASDFSGTPIIKSGARTQKFDLQFGKTYYSRVKTELSPDYGSVTSFSTAPAEFFTYITSPANNAVNLATTLNVTANTVTGAVSYTIELNTAADFTGTSIIKSGVRTQNFTNLEYGQTYYARVLTDLSPNYGAVRSFTTATPDYFSYVATPVNGAVNQSTTLSVVANTVPGALLYTIELNSDPAFGETTAITSTNSNRSQLFSGLKFNTTYYTRVKTNLAADWGGPRSFSTGSAASMGFLVDPKGGATLVPWKATLTANLIEGATNYIIQVSNDGNFEDDPVDVNDFIEKSSVANQIKFDLQPATVYTARVKVFVDGADQGWGEAATYRSFTTGDPVSLAYITSPAKDASNVNIYTQVKCNTVSGATTYTIALFEDASSLSDPEWLLSSSSNSILFSGLQQNKQFFARAKTDLSPDTWGEATAFTTGTFLSLAYVTTPGNKTTNVFWSLDVKSNELKDAAEYTIQLHTDPTFDDSKGTSFSQTGSSPNVHFNNLAYATTYYNRVKTNLDPSWGETRRFTTGSPSTLSYITSPANGAVNVNYITNVKANAIPGASNYIVELTPVNSNGVATGAAITNSGSSPTISFSLAEGQLYFAKVKTDLSTVWGPVRSFSTGDLSSLSIITSPKNNGTGVPSAVNVTANTIVGATNYSIELNTSPDFNGVSIVKSGTGTKKTFPFTLNTNTIYYGRVTHSLMAPGTWGEVTSFRTINPAGRDRVDWEVIAEEEEPIVLEPLSIQVTHNPFRDKLEFMILTRTSEEASFTLFDLSGRSIHQAVAKTNELITVEKQMNAGLYLLTVRDGNNSKVQRVVKID